MSGEEFLAWANQGCLEFFSGLVVFPRQEEGTAEAGRPEARRSHLACWSRARDSSALRLGVSVLVCWVKLKAHQGGCAGGGMPSGCPPLPRGWGLPQGPPTPSSACCCRSCYLKPWSCCSSSWTFSLPGQLCPPSCQTTALPGNLGRETETSTELPQDQIAGEQH